VDRGAGVDQPSVGVGARLLAAGDWLHIFPEGRVTPDGSVGPFRQGIGRLLCEAKAAAGGRWVQHSGCRASRQVEDVWLPGGTPVPVPVNPHISWQQLLMRM
jgi:1-acyl-sn-glycerol-3-phosphate acyltransferase